MPTPPVKYSEGFMPTVAKTLGYRPGTWYDEDHTMGPDGQRRFGNLVTGTGLGVAGALSVPIAQWLFPDKFKKFPGQGKRLALAAILGGVALPFLATAPAEMRAYSDYKARNKTSNANFPYMKTHLASTVLDEIRAGGTTPASAISFMQSIAEQTPTDQPWFTAGDVARAAIGAGAGAATGNLVGQGVGYFLGLTPSSRSMIRNVGMGLGALINTGKLGI